MGWRDVVDKGLNVSTGGLYGTVKGAYDGSKSGGINSIVDGAYKGGIGGYTDSFGGGIGAMGKKVTSKPMPKWVNTGLNITTGGLYGTVAGAVKGSRTGGAKSIINGAVQGGIDGYTDSLGGGVGALAKSQLPTSETESGKYTSSDTKDYEQRLFDIQASSLENQDRIAGEQNDRSQEQYGLWKDNYLPVEQDLIGQTGNVNDQNTQATNDYSKNSWDNTNKLIRNTFDNTASFNNQLDLKTRENNQAIDNFAKSSSARLNGHAGAFDSRVNGASNAYNKEIMGYANNMGQADQDIHGRMKANAYAGVDTGFDQANKDLQADLARRGLTGSGIFARSMGDLAGQKAMNYSATGARAYNDSISASDSRRRDKIGTRGQGFNGQMQAMQAGYGATSSALNNSINQERTAMMQTQNNDLSNLSTRYNNLQNDRRLQYNTNTTANSDVYKANTANSLQQLANNTGLAQLGRGMQTNSQNYLGQAGNSFGQNAQIAGGTATTLRGQDNSLIMAQMNADAQAQAGKGAMTGSMVGAGATLGAVALSDERLKENIEYVGDFYGYSFYTWDWNEKGLELADPNQPTFGVMAQEARHINPNAVHMEDDGYYRVDYNLIMGGAL